MPYGFSSSLQSLQVITAADPAANTEWSVTVPAGKMWIVMSVSVSLAQAATQTPLPVLVMDDGGSGVVFSAPGSTTAQAVNTTTRYTWGSGLTLSGQQGVSPNFFATAPLPLTVPLPAGYRVRTSTIGIGANTDYGVPMLLVDQYG